ncbi:MAG: hypothetical protein AB1403_00990 [Candidatus Riflebacteria bacterium]
MKKLTIMFLMLTLPLLVACSGGGDSGLDDALNPYGFVVAAFDTTNATTLATNDVRSVIRPVANGVMYAGTVAGIQSFDPAVTPPVFTTLAGAPANVNKLVADGTAGNFYACTDAGLFKYDATAKTFTLDASIGAKKVLTFTRQSDSIFWVGLEDLTAATESVARVENNVATLLGTAKGITASSVADIFVDSDIVMACGTGDTGKGGLFRYDPSGAAFVKQVVTTGLDKGASLFFKIGTTWYAGGPDSGLVTSSDSGSSWTKTNLQNCSPVHFSVETYNFVNNNRYWIATNKGAYLSYDMVNFVEWASAKNMAGDSARQTFSSSTVWVANDGATGGLSRLAFDGNY